MRNNQSKRNRIRAKAAGVSLALAFLLALVNCSPRDSSVEKANDSEITVAAAANLTDAFEEMGKQFAARSGIRVVYSFAATADLSKQIENGGPFDVFASADVEHVDALIGKGFLVAETRAIFARGRLVLWKPPRSPVSLSRVEDVASPDVKFVAIAKPEVAPYGRAAAEALRALGLWAQVEPKVVYSQNVSQAKQYAASGNADLAFLPLSLVRAGEGQYVEVEAGLYQPIDQAMAAVRASTKPQAARRFVEFVLSAEGRGVLEAFGYLKPAN
ncbi:MAG TPA: molybdate ABC transporter substrate-binding protein [Blastocatellia bacterium]|nr:molybdate ABC transporter substrate-binding protein [Blastocatellia bacterium]